MSEMKQKIFFTADTHFGHANAITFDKRPFKTVEEMDAEMIRRWNNKVGKGDIVYVLGDMIWKSMTNYAEPLIKSLNGQIILIKGNHDNFIKNAKAKKALAGVKDYDDIVVTLKNGVKRRCILCHYYMPFYVGHRYQTILLHGHSHESEEAYLEKEISKMLNGRGFYNESYNVGCMHWNYEPVTLDEILETNSNLDKYFYIIEEVNGKKMIHMQGNVYRNYLDRNCECRHAEWTFLYLEIEEAKAMVKERSLFDYLDENIAYLGDVSEAEAEDMCNNYFNDSPGIKLNITDVDNDTPCGEYWCNYRECR